ncbi:MAG TPA: hypothetical protein VNK91_01945 [Burkholderiaceae bacterium]|nr:hypothetical protein [Burkholderiaceae bacterium]
MPSVIQRSFAGGEIAPALHARADQVKYATGLRTCRNFEIQKHGGVANRSGFQYVATTALSGRRIRLIPFDFSDTQTYVLEFGNLYVRWITAGARLVVSGVPAWNNATIYQPADLVVNNGVNFYCRLTNIAQQPPNALYWYPLPGNIYEIPTTYPEADLQGLHFVQSADVLTITHRNQPPQELRREGHTRWRFVGIDTTVAGIAAPATPTITAGAAGSLGYGYRLTAVAANYEESLPSGLQTVTSAIPTESAPNVINWTAVTGAQHYRIYKSYGDTLTGFIGIANGTSFKDIGLSPDFSVTPPVAQTLFNQSGNYPATVGQFQQRRQFARADTAPETIWNSRSGLRSNFTLSYPAQDDNAITFTLSGRRVNEIRHLLELDARFLVLTTNGEWEIEGDVDGVLTPAHINPRQFGHNGAATVIPAIVDDTAVFVQARGNRLRDLRYEVVDTGGKTQSYRGRDLSVYAVHLFKRYAITELAYQQQPNSVVWAVRSDGALLGLTYVREHDIWGWHRHDTDGTVENICVVPEGGEDALYAVIARLVPAISPTIPQRYIERLHNRLVTNIAIDAFFVDSGLTYDGRHTAGNETMTLSGGTTWDVTEILTLSWSPGAFTASDIGNEIVLRAGGDTLRLKIVGFTSFTQVTVSPSKNVPTAFRNVAITNWGRAVDRLSGFGHLEGKTLVALGDGSVETGLVVTAGVITLSRPYEVIHAGLPYTADLETLDLEVVNGQTLADKQKRINRVTVFTEEARHLKAGDDADHLKELPIPPDLYASTSAVLPGKVEIVPTASWNNHGRVFIRHDVPLPLTINAIVPTGFVGG